MTESIRGRRFYRRGAWRLSVLIALPPLLFPQAVFAKEMTIAVYVEGPDAAALRNVFQAIVPPGTTVAETDAFRAALSQRGQKLPFGKTLDGDGHDRAIARVRGAVAASGLDGVFVARVVRQKNRRVVKMLFVESAPSGAPREGEVDLGPKKSRDDAGKMKGFVDAALETSPATAPKKQTSAEQPGAQPAADAAEKGPPSQAVATGTSEAARPAGQDAAAGHPRGSIARALFDVEVGVKGAGRHFGYNDGQSGNLRSFDYFPFPLLEANAEVFPLADAGSLLRDVGIVGSYSQSMFLTSAASSGPAVGTRETAYLVGVRFRIHPDGDSGFVLGVSDGFGSQSVDFDPSKDMLLNVQVPAVNCSGNRLAIDARVPLGRLAVLANFGYRAIFDQGVMAQRFRSSSATGIDAEVGGAFSITLGWEVRAIVDYERYFYAFKPVVGDKFVAGGALDQFYGGRLALAFIY